MERGLPIPESCYPPEVPEGLEPFVSAFWTLSTTRALGFGAIGPIPWTAIDAYAQRYGIVEDEVLYDDFVYIITQVDCTFLSVTRGISEKNAAAAKARAEAEARANAGRKR